LIDALGKVSEIGKGEPRAGNASVPELDIAGLAEPSQSKTQSSDRYPEGVEPLDPKVIK